MVVSEFLGSKASIICFKEESADASPSIMGILVVLFPLYVMVHSRFPLLSFGGLPLESYFVVSALQRFTSTYCLYRAECVQILAFVLQLRSLSSILQVDTDK